MSRPWLQKENLPEEYDLQVHTAPLTTNLRAQSRALTDLVALVGRPGFSGNLLFICP